MGFSFDAVVIFRSPLMLLGVGTEALRVITRSRFFPFSLMIVK